MRIRLEQYRQLQLSWDELCVAAAFLELPCLYGVSDRWIRKNDGGLHSRVMNLTAAMERRGLLLPEPGGVVRMDRQLYQMVQCMGQAEQMGRIRYYSQEEQGCVYLYRREDMLVFLEEDGRGGGYLGQLTSVGQLAEALTGIPAPVPDREREFGFLPSDWFSGLLFERRGSFYETVLDLAWSEDTGKVTETTDLKAGWQQLCSLMER